MILQGLVTDNSITRRFCGQNPVDAMASIDVDYPRRIDVDLTTHFSLDFEDRIEISKSKRSSILWTKTPRLDPFFRLNLDQIRRPSSTSNRPRFELSFLA